MLRRSFLLACGAAPLLGAPAATLTPAAPKSNAYSLAASPEGDVYLVWIETEGDNHSLKVSQLEGETWSDARTVASGADDWFVNWADHPAVAAGPNGRLLASWPHRTAYAGDSKWGLATRVVFSADRGRTWRKVCDLGEKNTADYSGFMGFWAGEDGFRAAYLSPLAEGEAQRDAGHVKTLRFADFSLNGELLSDELLDADVCTCCPLSTADTAAGPIVAYRDHEGPVRDISVVRRINGKWTSPQPLFRDNWEINGCPVNGAAIQAQAKRVVAAWFTGAADIPRVRFTYSTDAGASFAEPLQIDRGKPAGWTAVAMLDNGRTAVTWIERRPDEPGVADLLMRTISASGEMSDPRSIATTSSGRSTGMPQMVRSGNRLVLAWRMDDQVRTTTLDL